MCVRVSSGFARREHRANTERQLGVCCSTLRGVQYPSEGEDEFMLIRRSARQLVHAEYQRWVHAIEQRDPRVLAAGARAARTARTARIGGVDCFARAPRDDVHPGTPRTEWIAAPSIDDAPGARGFLRDRSPPPCVSTLTSRCMSDA